MASGTREVNLLEQLIRIDESGVSCATHFLDLHVEEAS